MDPKTSQPDSTDLWIAANRATVYGTVGRWLLHDLRNPVQALALVTELFTDEPTTALDPTLVTTLVETSAHLTRTLELQDRVLRLPELPADPFPLSLSPLLDFFRTLHATRRTAVTLTVDGGPDVPAVAASEPALEHALLNLLVNAYQAVGERGDGHVEVRVVPAEGMVDIVVEDNGPGLPPEIGERAFEPFVTTRPGRPFAGLGLPVARLLLQRMGGDLVRDEAPRGLRMRARVPVWRPDATRA